MWTIYYRRHATDWQHCTFLMNEVQAIQQMRNLILYYQQVYAERWPLSAELEAVACGLV